MSAVNLSGEVSDPLVARFIAQTAMLLDKGALEAWIDCFDETSKYIVMPRENRDQGHALALMHCGNKNILRDRVAVLVHANKFNPHVDRHILGPSLVGAVDRGIASVETNFMVVQSTLTGVSSLFCAGCYEDRIDVSRRDFKLVERTVLLDTFCVPNLLATPL